MKPDNPYYFKNRQEWRRWLEQNHARQKEAWLIYYKKHTGKPRISYDAAVEEAICFGWIDGQVKRIDHEKHMQRFSPRRKNSLWADSNIKRAKEMIRLGKMTEPGMERFRLHEKTRIPQVIEMPKSLEKALKANKKAWQNFQNFPASHRKHFFWMVLSAKKPETAERRIRKIVNRANRNERLM